MKKVLIVDDDREWNFLLKMQISRAGFQTEQAYNGQEAIDKIPQVQPDLVLLDVTMPILDGMQVCKILREKPETKDLPIIILSSYTQPQDIQQGKSFQVKRYLLKPCSIEVVLQSVRDVLAQK